ncbi:hypothetical protein EYZ11_009997 [Aspergillus tanneri]|uniref:Uncharacterized protein n=1 Tax=Aspergillus tanneri TaxID=1220188 RepID=A0A4V3UNB4_9EURO|nr:hypothetical protein EYZ11_009997 [Aspergillus tanneri]
MAYFLGLEAVVRQLLGTVEVNTRDYTIETTLAWAADNGHEMS